MKKYTLHIVWAVIAIAAFAGGMMYGKASVQSSLGSKSLSSSTRGLLGAGGLRGANANGQTVLAGQVLSLGSGNMTVQLPNGNSEVVLYSTSTSVSEPTEVPVGKIASGQDVMVVGASNADGSVTASSIQIRNASDTAAGFGK